MLNKQNQIIESLMIDKEDRHFLFEYSLFKDGGGYIVCDKTQKGVKTRIKLHHLVFGKPQKGLVIDHINRNKLDNRKSNLREVSYALNLTNSKKRIDSKQLYKGIQLLPSGRFSAKTSKGKRIGTFETPESAHIAYLSFINNKFKLCLH